MSRLFKRGRMLVAVLVTALAFVVAGAVPALAAEPGESAAWTNESIGGGQVNSPDTYSEARSPSTSALVQIYRGDDDRVWVAVNNGPAFAAGGGTNTTVTHVAPRVVYLDGWFYAFQTGTDNRIYWSRAFDGIVGSNTPSVSLAYNWSGWTAISGNPATQQSVSVAAVPGQGLLMTWLGVNQTAMYSAWLQSGSDVFNPTQSIPHNSNSAPVVTYSDQDNEFYLVYRGLLDNQVYMTEQILGQSTWLDNTALTGLTTPTSPTIAADANGNLLVAAIDMNDNIWFQAINGADETHGWSRESVGEQSVVPLWISVISSIFYVLATNSDIGGVVQWKLAWNAGKGI